MELDLDKIYEDVKNDPMFENDHEVAWGCVVRVLNTVAPSWHKGRNTPIYNAMQAIATLATPEPQPGDTELVYVYQMSSKPRITRPHRMHRTKSMIREGLPR